MRLMEEAKKGKMKKDWIWRKKGNKDKEKVKKRILIEEKWWGLDFAYGKKSKNFKLGTDNEEGGRRWTIGEMELRLQNRRCEDGKAALKRAKGKSDKVWALFWAWFTNSLCWAKIYVKLHGLIYTIKYKNNVWVKKSIWIKLKEPYTTKINKRISWALWCVKKDFIKTWPSIYSTEVHLSYMSVVITLFNMGFYFNIVLTSNGKIKAFSCSPIFLPTNLTRLELVLSIKSYSYESGNTWQSLSMVNTRGIRKVKQVEVLRVYKRKERRSKSYQQSLFNTNHSRNRIGRMNYRHHHSLTYARLLRESLDRVKFLTIEPKLYSANAINPNMSLLIRVLSSKNIPVAAVNRAIKNSWKFTNPILVEDYNNNVFKITVACEEDLRYLCFHSPGIVLSHHAFIRLWNANTPFNHVDIMHSCMWIQVRDLAITQNTLDNLLRLSARVGQLDMIDYTFDELESITVLRFKVYVAVDEPLVTGAFTVQEDGICWIKFYYENIGLVCFNCGILGHHRDHCLKPVKRFSRDSSEYLMSDWSAKMMIKSPETPIYGLYWKNGLNFEAAEFISVRNGRNNHEEQVIPNMNEHSQRIRNRGRYFSDGNLEREEAIRIGSFEVRGQRGESSRRSGEMPGCEKEKEIEFIPIEVIESSESSAGTNGKVFERKEGEQDGQTSMSLSKRVEESSVGQIGKKRPRMWSAGTMDDDQFDGVEVEFVSDRIEEGTGGEEDGREVNVGEIERPGTFLMGAPPAQNQGVKFT